MYAVGRQCNTDRIGIENCGLTTDKRGKLSVNENYQTEVPHIYAAGDVIGFPSLASSSVIQGPKKKKFYKIFFFHFFHFQFYY